MIEALSDVLIVIFLIGGIFYANLVNRRVKRLMDLLRELEPAVQQFSHAVDKSELSVAKMQHSLSETLSRHDKSHRSSMASTADEPPLFSSQRIADVRDMGVRVIRDKQELVRQFFDTTRNERKV